MSAYYRSALLTSAVCHKHCMTVTSVLYRSAVGRSAIPYCNSDVVIKVGGRQVATVNKLYDLSIADLSTADLSTADLSILYFVFVDRRPAYQLHIPCCLPNAYLSTADLSTYLLLIMQYLSTADLSIFYFSSSPLYLQTYCLPPTCLPTYVQ